MQAQELNDALQSLDVQPGQDIPGVHMPNRLQQLRGIMFYTGLAADEQNYLTAHKLWADQVEADARRDSQGVSIAMLDEAKQPSAPATVPSVATSEVVQDSGEMQALRHEMARMATRFAALQDAPVPPVTAADIIADPVPITSVPMEIPVAPVAPAPAFLSMNGSTITLADLQSSVVASEVKDGGDPVGTSSYILHCIQYGLATMMLMITLTLCLGFYAGAKHAFAPSDDTLDTVVQRGWLWTASALREGSPGTYRSSDWWGVPGPVRMCDPII